MSRESTFSSKIENLLGLTVDITLNNNVKIIGNVFTLNPNSKIIILVNKKNENKNYNISIINIIEIKKIELSKNQIDINIDDLCHIDLKNIKEKDKNNLEKDNLIKRAETEPNFKKGFELYEELSKFYNCSYDGKKIIINEINCIIEEPFSYKNLYCENEKYRKQIEKIISFRIKNKNK